MSKICLPVGRVVYSHLVEPSAAVEGAAPFYSVTISFPADVDLSKVHDAVKNVANEKFQKVPSNLVCPVKPNDIKEREDGTLPAGFHEGGSHITLKQGDIKDVALRTRDLKDGSPEDYYAGSWVQAIAHLHAYKVTNPGVTAYAKGLRFVKDDQPLGGSSPDVSFDALDDEDDNNTPF